MKAVIPQDALEGCWFKCVLPARARIQASRHRDLVCFTHIPRVQCNVWHMLGGRQIVDK